MDSLEPIKQKIYEIRGLRVMLDFDLASLYGVDTRVLNQAVKRNIERFPEDFMFQLTKGEWEICKSQFLTNAHTLSQTIQPKDNCKSGSSNLTSQIVISRFSDKTNSTWGGTRRIPFAFTENGVAMLSSVLRSPLAIQVNIGIMRAFTEFRKVAASLPTHDDVAQLRKDFEELKLDIEEILHDQNDINESTRMQIDAISTALAELQSKEPRQKPHRRIGFIQDEE
ncbi:MAG: ORF6N domain-containing protein [Prevotella sp.]|nr:ORF6N domain-containing protein [Prevotella sp.]